MLLLLLLLWIDFCLIMVTYAQQTCTRNLHQVERNSIRAHDQFLLPHCCWMSVVYGCPKRLTEHSSIRCNLQYQKLSNMANQWNRPILVTHIIARFCYKGATKLENT